MILLVASLLIGGAGAAEFRTGKPPSVRAPQPLSANLAPLNGPAPLFPATGVNPPVLGASAVRQPPFPPDPSAIRPSLQTAETQRPESSEQLAAPGQVLFDQAGFLEDLELPELFTVTGGFGTFVSPNEQMPSRALPILRRAGPGVYVSVGTERGFIGAALTPKADSLLLLDRDAHVVRYNRVNAALLALAKDRRDYLELRRWASHEDWRARAPGVAPELRALLEDAQLWAWWRKTLREPGFESLHAPPPPVEGPYAFQGANYLHDDALFARLHAMAKAGRIKAHQLELGDSAALPSLVRALKAGGVQLSVLDISNAWGPAYMDELGVESLVQAFGAVASPSQSLLMLSGAFGRDASRSQFDVRSKQWIWGWDYVGFPLGALLGNGEVASLIVELRRRAAGLPSTMSLSDTIWAE